MIKINLKVPDPVGDRDRLTKTIYWTVVPRKGEMVDLVEPDSSSSGGWSRVEDVHHWIGSGQIDVICKVDTEREFDSLIEEGWKRDG